jgi:hypothetical protein
MCRSSSPSDDGNGILIRMGTAESKGDVPMSASRRDVLKALELLAQVPPACSPDGRDPRQPNLSQALSWLIEDTFWGRLRRRPMDSVGTLLRSEREAECVDEVVTHLVLISQRCGPEAPDVRWFEDSSWVYVREAAGRAATALRA